MEATDALRIIQSLVDGVDPCTSQAFPEDNPYQKPAIMNALFTAIRALESYDRRQRRAHKRPENRGKSWSESEDHDLCREFDMGMTIVQMADEHKRSKSAIRARLRVLGKIATEDSKKEAS